MENRSQPTNKTNLIHWIIVIVVVITLGITAYFFFSQEEGANTTVNTNTFTNKNVNTVGNANINTIANSNTNTSTNTNIDTSGWETYESDKYGFSFKYPTGWKVSSYPARVVVYKGELEDNGFSLFIISGDIDDVKEAINNIQTLEVAQTTPIKFNNISTEVIEVIQNSVNKLYKELAIDLKNSYFIRLSPYELDPVTGFPFDLENQYVSLGIVESFNVLNQ